VTSAQTAGQALVVAVGKLRQAGVSDPARDARVLLAHAARVDASRITLMQPEPINAEISDRFDRLIALRAQRMPVSHLIGEREFYGRKFKVSGDVLDPRPETECLIEAALAEPFSRVLDIGTGSGCIITTLLAENPNAQGVATDLSEAACLQASQNAVLHGVGDRVEIRQTSWAEGILGSFDLIVSNPPYIAQDEMPGLSQEVRLYEPHMALTDFGDGLSAYRAIAAQVGGLLAADGRLIVEMGPTQGAEIREIFERVGLKGIVVLPDFDRRDRLVLARGG